MLRSWLSMNRVRQKDNRKGGRTETFLGAQVSSLDGSSPVLCVMKDMSPKGVRIRIPALLELPKDVYLIDHNNARAHYARVRWKRPPEYGLSFVRSYAFNDTLPLPLARLIGRFRAKPDPRREVSHGDVPRVSYYQQTENGRETRLGYLRIVQGAYYLAVDEAKLGNDSLARLTALHSSLLEKRTYLETGEEYYVYEGDVGSSRR